MEFSRNRPRATGTPVALLLLAICTTTAAVDFAGGTGQWDDPYRIATAEQLLSIGSDYELLGSYYVLIADIDLDPNLSADYAFQESPIPSGFSGVFDGRGHRIHHLTITDTTEDDHVRCSLFQSIDAIGKVKHLVLEDVRIISSSNSGAVAGLCGGNSGVIFQCSVTGTLSGSNIAGGLVASNGGLVEECCSDCTVSAPQAGGLIGFNAGLVRDCRSAGRVSEAPGARITIGGLIGVSPVGSVLRSYTVCRVEGTSPFSGGLVGRTERDKGEAENSYFLDPSEGGGPDNGVGTALTSEQMKRGSNFAGWDFWEGDNDGRPAVWYIKEGGSPELIWLALAPALRSRGLPVAQACELLEAEGVKVGAIVHDYDYATPVGHMITARPRPGASPSTALEVVSSLGPCDWATNPGNGTAASPYLILSAGQLDCLAHEPVLWDRHFKLLSDLDLAGRIYARPLIGHSESEGLVFEGTFDGGGHLIKNLTIEGCGSPEIGFPVLGLFGEIGTLAIVKDLGLTEVSAKGRRGGAGSMLCAVSGGVIERCYCTGVLRGDCSLGGLVGRNTGVIANSYAHGRVEKAVGSNSYCAGLVFWNHMGTIDTCYTTCAVPEYEGYGVVGRNNNGTVENCLWDVENSGVHSSDGGTGLTTAGMQTDETFLDVGWDFQTVWMICEWKDYPRLQWEGIGCED